MKKKIFLVMSAVLVFGLAIAVYAFNTAGSVDASTKAACCCCKGDTCPMKDKNAAATDKTAAHDGCDCCQGGADACPMKKGDTAAGDIKTEGGMKPDMKMANGEMCPMMKGDANHKMDGEMNPDMKMANGEMCPMMKGDANHKMEGGMKMEMKADGSCACCKHAKEKKAAPAI